jgi:DNA-binding transcriptional MerR regulator
MADKSDEAFRTIGELATELGVAQHVLRYWEGRFPQLRPLQRAGNRRYYRPADVALARRIDRLLNHEGYTVKGVQKLLEAEQGGESMAAPSLTPPAAEETVLAAAPDLNALRLVRDGLVLALAEDEVAL